MRASPPQRKTAGRYPVKQQEIMREIADAIYFGRLPIGTRLSTRELLKDRFATTSTTCSVRSTIWSRRIS